MYRGSESLYLWATKSQQLAIVLICIFIPQPTHLQSWGSKFAGDLRAVLKSHLSIPGCRKHNLGLCTHTQTRLTPALSNGKSDTSAATARQSGLYLRVEQVCAIRSLALSYWFKIEQTVAAHQTTGHWFLLCLYRASICSPFLRPTRREPLKTHLSVIFLTRKAGHGGWASLCLHSWVGPRRTQEDKTEVKRVSVFL